MDKTGEHDIVRRAQEIDEGAERAALIDGACGDDATLRAEVEALLRDDAETGSLLESTEFASADDRSGQRAEQLEQVARFQSEQLAGIDVPWMALRLREDLRNEVLATSERSGLESEAIEVQLNELERVIAGVDFTGMALHTLEANVFERV